MRRLAIAVLLLSGAAWGQSPGWVTFSYEPQAKAALVTALPPQHVRVKAGLAVLASKATTEVSFDWDERLVQDGWVYEDAAKKTLVLTSPVSGTYRVTATWFEPTKGKFKEVWYVTFETGPPPPPGPGPLPPPPPDTLETRLKKAYDADRAAGKVTESELRLVGEIFKSADQFFAVIPTTGTLYQVLDLGLSTAAPKGMPECRKVADAHLEKVASHAKDVPLTDALKKQFGVAFAELAKAVEACLAPQPPPGPGPSPTPVSGFRVLFVSESSANHTREQLNILNSTAIAAYLNAKASKDEKGRPAWRRWDKDVDVSNELESWKTLWAAVKPKLGAPPVLVISGDRGVEVLPLPATEAATLELLRKYGGP